MVTGKTILPIFNLKTCGCKRRVSWIKLKNGGRTTLSRVVQILFSQKLRCLKKDITDWNREIFGKMETRKSKALDELMVIEQAIEKRHPSQAEKDKMMVLKMELQQIAKAEEVSWRQKCKCLWLKEGDRNTKYFQSSRRRNNQIDILIQMIHNETDAHTDGCFTFVQKLVDEIGISFNGWKQNAIMNLILPLAIVNYRICRHLKDHFQQAN
ncbi:hypothetical protein H5410_008629 [Solanum commersonii]|uniref:Uncharacterized protein n=1 Tax=Solanum commersonii TaxID=4109 RepID=A0A9J6AGC4_SOLCO|nr:hypothetical protein H5410_008629 [Solanum commersonii]